MNAFAGTGNLIRLILRRDRILLPIWMVLITWMAIVVAIAFSKLYPTAPEIATFAQQVNSSVAEVAMLGPVYSLDLQGLTAWRWNYAAAIVLGVVNLLSVIRHTRVEEETGRRDLLGGTVVGRYAPLTAALLVQFAANGITGIMVGLVLRTYGFPLSGSLALGLGAAGWACVMACIGGIAAQLTEYSGTARGLAIAVISAFYLLRAVGDSAPNLSAFKWISPMGWMSSIRPYAGEQWWVFGLYVLAVIALTGIAFILASRRDVGGGFFPAIPGPAMAAPSLRNALALAWRMHRSAILAWIVGYGIFGFIFGLISNTLVEQLSANPLIMAILKRTGMTPNDAFITFVLMMGSEVSAAYAIISTLRLRGEETDQRVEPLLALPLSRLEWVTSHLICVAIGTVLILGVFGLTAGLSVAITNNRELSYEVPRMIAAAIAFAPAVWVFAGIAVVLFGFIPQWASFIAWGSFISVLLIDMFGEFSVENSGVGLRILSPFNHVPKVLIPPEILSRFAGQGPTIGLVGLLGIVAILLLIGILGFQRRDVASA